jgi:hypothetical protein
MEDLQDNEELHPIIQKILGQLEVKEEWFSEYNVYLDSAIRTRKKWEFSEDESEWNQNFLGIREHASDAEIDELREKVAEYREKMEDLKILMRIFMEVFNKGWSL